MTNTDPAFKIECSFLHQDRSARQVRYVEEGQIEDEVVATNIKSIFYGQKNKKIAMQTEDNEILYKSDKLIDLTKGFHSECRALGITPIVLDIIVLDIDDKKMIKKMLITCCLFN